MPTFNTPNSQHSYTVPTGAVALDLIVHGGPGGTSPQAAAGAAGQVSATIPVTGGETFTVYVGEAGGDGEEDSNAVPDGGSGGSSPIDGGVSGGDGGDGSESFIYSAGGGGAPSAVVRDSDGAEVAVGGGGGGGSTSIGGGGGGARGGAGGTGSASSVAGGDGDGTGVGGDGGDDGQNPGQDGATITHGDLQSVSTGTSTAGPSVEIIALTVPAAPQDLTIADARDTELDSTWTDDDSTAQDDEDGYRAYKDDGSGETQVADLPADTESYTLTGLKNGEEYTVRVEAYNDAGSADDSVVGQTTLPDAQQPMLDTTIEDELGVEITDVTNDGDYRVQIRETGETAWDGSAVGYHEEVLASDSDTSGTISATFQNLEDGEEYEARVRTETEHVTGSWTTPVSGTLPFPAPTNLTIDDRFDTVELSYQDNSDNESNVKLRRSPAGEGDWTTIATYSPNTTSVEDDTRVYHQQFDYRIRQETEHTFSVSNTVTAIPEPEERPPRVSPEGWTVVVRHPKTNRKLHPDVLDEPTFSPGPNALPEVRIPVRQNDIWLQPEMEDDPAMDVWLDGQKLPIDELREVDDRTGRTILVGIGGVELEQRVQAEFTAEQRDVAASTLVATETSYNRDFDTPVVDTLTDQDIQAADTQTEIEAVLNPNSETPLVVESGTAQPAQTCWTETAVGLIASNASLVEGDDYVNGFARSLDAEDSGSGYVGGVLEIDVDLDYVIPADGNGSEQFQIAIRAERGGDSLSADLEFYWDQGPSESIQPTNTVSISPPLTIDGWAFFDPLDGNIGDVDPGNHTLYIHRSDTDADTDLLIDCVAPHDTRFGYSFDTDLDEPGGNLDGPELYPQSVTMETEDALSAFSIGAAHADLTIDDTSNQQRVQLSNDRGLSWEPDTGPEENTSSVTADFGGVTGSTLRMRVDLARYAANGARDDTPRFGYSAQVLDAWDVDADLDLELLLIDQTYDDSLVSVLNDVAGEESLWTYNLDGDGNPQISWTREGQRTTDRDPDLVDASITKEQTIYETVTIKGSNQRRSDVDVPGDADTFDLGIDTDIDAGSDILTDGSGVSFDRGVDYEMDYQNGTISAIDSGSLRASQTYTLDFEIEIVGRYTAPDASQNPRELVEQVPGVTSVTGAEQIAFVLAEELDTPRYGGDLTVANADVNFDPLESVPLDGLNLPDEATPIDIRGEPQITPSGIQFRVGSRGRMERSLSSITETVSQLAKRG